MIKYERWLSERAKKYRFWSRQMTASEDSRERCEGIAFELELALSKVREEMKGGTPELTLDYYETSGPVDGRLAEHDKDLGRLYGRVHELEDKVSDLAVRLSEIEKPAPVVELLEGGD